jgi:hypothetical protein
MNTTYNQKDQKKQQGRKTQQERGQKKQVPDRNMLQGHEQEHPETRLTR